MESQKIGPVSVVLLCLVAGILGGSLNVNNGQYVANWEIRNASIEIEIGANTTGYVGFGLNSYSSMRYADLIIAGVDANQTEYIQDLHGANGNITPYLDASQDYYLINATESAGRTTVRFWRALVTGDANDRDITNSTVTFLWSIGRTDTLQIHGARGSVVLNFFDESTHLNVEAPITNYE